MELDLVRFAYAPSGTFGRLMVDRTHYAWTVEAPWRNNRPYASCVPVGLYVLEQHDGRKYRNTYALRGEALDGRTACVIHAGNNGRDFMGCIGLGKYGGRCVGGAWAVQSSRGITREFIAILDKHLHDTGVQSHLAIRNFDPLREFYGVEDKRESS